MYQAGIPSANPYSVLTGTEDPLIYFLNGNTR